MRVKCWLGCCCVLRDLPVIAKGAEGAEDGEVVGCGEVLAGEFGEAFAERGAGEAEKGVVVFFLAERGLVTEFIRL